MKKEFSRFEKLIGTEAFEKLTQKTVCVVGVGGVGGYVVESFVRSGIESLILVDFDKVDVTNLNRQIIALQSTIGKDKVDVFKDRILDINPSCKVKTYRFKYDESKKDFLFHEKIDFLVDACDDIKAKESLIETCLAKGIPFISSMGTGKRLDPSKLIITTLKKTSYDPLARILRKWVKDNEIKGVIPVLSSLEAPLKIEGREVASSSFVPASAGLLIASYVIKELQKK